MLDIITKSKVRQNILKLLFSGEKQEYYLSEIARKIKTSPGTAQRELNKLIGLEIVNTEKMANVRYYSLNKTNPLSPEMKKIISKTIGLEAELVRAIKPIKGIEYAFVFGSYAKKKFNSGSDIDLYIVGTPDENILINKIRRLEKTIDREVNYHISAASGFKAKLKKNSFLKNIIKNYTILTDNHEKFKQMLKQAD